MTTLDFIRRSDEVVAPPKYHFKAYTRASHGSTFSVGATYGIEDRPLLATSVSMGIGILIVMIIVI